MSIDENKVKAAIDRLRLAAEMSETYYHKPIMIAYSGGKDSDTVLSLAQESGIDFEVIMNITTVEAPQTMIHAHETARKIRENGKQFTFLHARDKDGKPLNMRSVCLQKKILPTRIARFCCAEFKEIGTPDRLIALGVRSSESLQRSKNYDIFSIRVGKKEDKLKYGYDHALNVFSDALTVSEDLGESPEIENAFDCQLITAAKRNNEITVQPILDWKESDVWNYIRGRGVKYNPLYDMGYHRVGCVGCPMGSQSFREKEFRDFPGLERYWMKICDDLLKMGAFKKPFKDAQEVFDWWLERERQIEGQLSIWDFLQEERGEPL